MKVVVFQGGLGNQLFQYAYYSYLYRKYKKITYIYVGNSHNGFELTKYFEVQNFNRAHLVFEKLFRLIKKCYMHNIKFLWSDENSDSVSLYSYGYWLNKKFLSNEIIEFKKFTLMPRNLNVFNLIKAKNSVSIHIRRGDYLLPQFYNIFGNICTPQYYEKAIEIVKERIDNICYFIFSDDISWAKENIKLENMIFIDWNTGNDSIYDMFLMSKCKVNIIANSTFSFWAAYLNDSSQIVIYPKIWYNTHTPDIFPETWIPL